MDYIAVIDYEHLDNGVFLTSLARSLAQQKNTRGIFIHGASAYTERLIQTGMMREDAVVRAVKDLNHRLIALFADQGVSAIGLNGYQRSLVKKSGENIIIDEDQFRRLPEQPHLLLSNLIETESRTDPVQLELPGFAGALRTTFDIDDVIVFSLDDSEDFIKKEKPGFIHKDQLDSEYPDLKIPGEFKNVPISIMLSSAGTFASYPSTGDMTYISES